VSEDVIFVAAIGGCWLALHVLTKVLDAWVQRARLNLQREQLRDQVFRDACNTIHCLRIENDALTAMVMAQQGRN